MFRFASPEYLYALALPIIIIVVYVLSNMWHKRRMNRLGNSIKLWKLVDNRSVIRIHVSFDHVDFSLSASPMGNA